MPVLQIISVYFVADLVKFFDVAATFLLLWMARLPVLTLQEIC